MQRVFDVENEKDMQDLWDILPDEVYRIILSENHIYYDGGDKKEYFECSGLIAINWHDKTEITRPIQEATEQDAGKICAFWDINDEEITYGTLSNLIIEDNAYGKYGCVYGKRWKHCRRLTKQEIEELC